MKKITILSLGLLLGAAAQPALAQSTTTGRAAASSTSSIPSSATASFPELRGKKWDQLNDAERQALLRTANPDWDKWSVDQRSAATSGYRTQWDQMSGSDRETKFRDSQNFLSSTPFRSDVPSTNRVNIPPTAGTSAGAGNINTRATPDINDNTRDKTSSNPTTSTNTGVGGTRAVGPSGTGTSGGTAGAAGGRR